MPEDRPRSPWLYVGIGCLVVLGLTISGALSLGLLGYRWAKQVESEIKDPALRLERVLEVLGCEELPGGYHPVVGLSLPFVTDVAVLSDKPLHDLGERGGPFGQRGFIYVKLLLTPGRDEQALRDYFTGRTDDPEVLRRHKINVRTRSLIGRGVLEGEHQTLLYLTQRGEVELSDHRGEGLNALVLVECPQDRKLRLGIWFGPDPAHGGELTEAELAGSVADPEAIQAFMNHFRLCG